MNLSDNKNNILDIKYKNDYKNLVPNYKDLVGLYLSDLLEY
jgi:hypothetical protein